MRNGPNCAPLATCSIRARNVSRGGASAKWAKTSNRPLASSNTPTATGEGPHASSSACAIRSAAASSAAILASYKIGSAGAIAERRCPRSARSCMARKLRRPRHQQAILRLRWLRGGQCRLPAEADACCRFLLARRPCRRAAGGGEGRLRHAGAVGAPPARTAFAAAAFAAAGVVGVGARG